MVITYCRQHTKKEKVYIEDKAKEKEWEDFRRRPYKEDKAKEKEWEDFKCRPTKQQAVVVKEENIKEESPDREHVVEIIPVPGELTALSMELLLKPDANDSYLA